MEKARQIVEMYYTVASVEDVLALLDNHGAAAVLVAGGAEI